MISACVLISIIKLRLGFHKTKGAYALLHKNFHKIYIKSKG